MPGSGLVYITAAPFSAARTRGRGGPRPRSASVPSRPATAPPPAPLDPAPPAGAVAAGGGAGGGKRAGSPQGAPRVTMKESGWESVNALSAGLPLTAVGLLDTMDEDGWWIGCSASVFANSAVVTAAVRLALFPIFGLR